MIYKSIILTIPLITIFGCAKERKYAGNYSCMVNGHFYELGAYDIDTTYQQTLETQRERRIHFNLSFKNRSLHSFSFPERETERERGIHFNLSFKNRSPHSFSFSILRARNRARVRNSLQFVFQKSFSALILNSRARNRARAKTSFQFAYQKKKHSPDTSPRAY